MRVTNWRKAATVACALALACFVTFALCAARDIVFGDGGELTVAAATNGVAHPPGYPLWIVLAHALSIIPIGTVPFRINLTASLYHAITVALVFMSALVLTRKYVPAVLAALLLAATPLFVTWSLQAEVFSLNDVFAATVVLFALLILDDGRRWRLVLPLAATFGLGLANQQTLVLLAPLPLWALTVRRKSIPLRKETAYAVAGAGLLFVAGFALPYVHTLTASQRELGWAFGEAHSLRELMQVISRSAYGTTAMVNGPLVGGTVFGRLIAMLTSIGIVACAALAGAVVATRERRYEIAGAVAWIVCGTIVAFCTLANNDASVVAAQGFFLRFALLPIVALAPFSAVAFAVVLEARILPAAMRPATASILIGAIAVFGLASARAQALSNVHDARTLVRDEFAALPRGAVAFVRGDAIATTAPYFQIVEGWRPDLTLVYVDLLPGRWYDDRLRRTIAVPQTYEEAPSVEEIVAANPGRTFFCIGDPSVPASINASGGPYVALTRGLASEVVARGTFIPLRNWYAGEKRQQESDGYGNLSGRNAGFVAVAHTYYANGFYNAGLDAERLGDGSAARRWFAVALSHVPDSSTIIDAFIHLNRTAQTNPKRTSY